VLIKAYRDLGVDYVIEGQAAGIDLIAARAAWNIKVPYEAVMPYAGHINFNKDPKWAEQYREALVYADEITVLLDSETYPGPWAFHKRNKYMVDNADAVLAVWDGSAKGGTAAAVKYALSKDRPLYRIHPTTLERTVLNEVRTNPS
jgi:uncharacterized phage-like protein YoqJ